MEILRMKRYKINDRVRTINGVGTIVKFETISDDYPRVGVKHDIIPASFKDGEILYYFFNEINRIKSNN